MAWISAVENGARLQVLIVPRASSTQIVGIHDDRLKIKLTAPPVDGKANQALVRFLAKRLNVSKDQFNIVSGETARRKTLTVDALSVDEVEKHLLLR
jgi:uncharacterized protein (TIGR00251 family)